MGRGRCWWLVAAALIAGGCIGFDWDYEVGAAPGPALPGTQDAGGDAGDAEAAPAPACGDGAQDEGEACDDGNTESGDGCRGDCLKVEKCGDGVTDEGEACDDGNTIAGDGCRADCLGTEQCGDGLLDGLLETPVKLRFQYLATNYQFGSPPGLEFTVNGQKLVSPPVPDTGTCVLLQEEPNPELVHSFEVTDPKILATLKPQGNTFGISTEAAALVFLSWAKVTIVGKTHGQDVIIADLPPVGSAEAGVPDMCAAGLTFDPYAGEVSADLNLGEECDDGNDKTGDGCLPNCIRERCGDGVVQPVLGEECDDGSTLPFDDCSYDCRPYVLAIEKAVAARTAAGDLVVLVDGKASETGAGELVVDYLDGNGLNLSPSRVLTVEDLRLALQTEFSARFADKGIFKSEDPALAKVPEAVAVRLKLRDIAKRVSEPPKPDVSLVATTCGNAKVEPTEECDDGNLEAGDTCSPDCRKPKLELRILRGARTNKNDLVLLVEGTATVGGDVTLDADFFKDGNPAGSAKISFSDPEKIKGSFFDVVRQIGFFDNPFMAGATSVSAALHDSKGPKSKQQQAPLALTDCGDGKLAPLVEECDDGNDNPEDNCDNHCIQHGSGGPGCDGGPGQCALARARGGRGEGAWAALVLLALLGRRAAGRRWQRAGRGAGTPGSGP